MGFDEDERTLLEGRMRNKRVKGWNRKDSAGGRVVAGQLLLTCYKKKEKDQRAPLVKDMKGPFDQCILINNVLCSEQHYNDKDTRSRTTSPHVKEAPRKTSKFSTTDNFIFNSPQILFCATFPPLLIDFCHVRNILNKLRLDILEEFKESGQCPHLTTNFSNDESNPTQRQVGKEEVEKRKSTFTPIPTFSWLTLN